MRAAGRVLRSLAVAGVLALSVPVVPVFAKGPESVAALAEQLSPAVVNIGTSRRVPGGGGVPFPDLPDGSPLEELFDEHNPNSGLGEEQMQEARSLGSGFIISAEGIVVTNNHVIEGAEEIEVYLTDGTRLPATIVGKDDKTDLAVLKVDAGHELPFVEFGDSDKAVVGDWVMAIGNPFGLGGSVTLGIVSARNRDIQSGPYDQFIQTDAAINQGNFGIGFAVPVNLARPVIDQLAEFGETRRGWLGVGIQEVSEDIASSLGLKSTAGALVIDVTKGGPSEGQVIEGDIILEFDSKPIARMRDLPRVVAETEVGKAVPVKILRNGAEQTLSITLGRLELGEQLIAKNNAPATPAPAPAPEPTATEEEAPPPGLPDLVGFDVALLDEDKRAEFGIAPEEDGIVVTSVKSGSDADQKGFIPGLLVTEVNQKEIGTVDELSELVAEAKEAGRPAVLFKVIDPTGTSRFIAVRLS